MLMKVFITARASVTRLTAKYKNVLQENDEDEEGKLIVIIV